ncbi:TetR/AcrR family transcriptional regulator [Nonomuraea sp. NPDC001636]|uniref:TetR/AcrR family transcriptional regulator n=1 Tax=Nonomuraea sp. NPDC001636 TaxID=3154391 RepID=UPI00332F8534
MADRRPDRRSPEAAQAVMRAALELCAESGYRKLSIEGIATRAGVGKNTIYRWWPSKAAVLMDALLSTLTVDAAFPDTGDIRADLIAQISAGARLLADPRTGPHYRALIGEAQHDPDVADALWERLIGPLSAAATDRIRRAQQQGQLRAEAAPDLIIELLYGPIYHRWLLTRRIPDDHRIAVLVNLALSGLTPTSSGV